MKVMIVDDERSTRERLWRLLSAHPDVRVVGEAAEGRQALEMVVALAPDVVLLDVDMPELSGLDVAAALGDKGPAVVFCAASDDPLLQIFEQHAVDYLMKPVEEADLAEILTRLKKANQPRQRLGEILQQLSSHLRVDRLALRCGARFIVCELSQVSAIVAKDHYAQLFWSDRRILADDPLEALASRLDQRDFFRIHRGSLINLRFLKELRRTGDRKYVAVLADPFGTELPVSRERLGALKETLGLTS